MEVVSLALLKDDKILVVRDREKDFWTLPGGKIERKKKEIGDGRIVESKETKIEALKREAKEEIPLVNWKNLNYYDEFFGVTPHGRQCIVIYVFYAEYSGGSIEPHSEITGSKWIDKEEAKLKTTQSTQNIINSIYVDLSKTN